MQGAKSGTPERIDQNLRDLTPPPRVRTATLRYPCLPTTYTAAAGYHDRAVAVL